MNLSLGDQQIVPIMRAQIYDFFLYLLHFEKNRIFLAYYSKKSVFCNGIMGI